MKDGFSLEPATKTEFVVPTLPAGCQIKSVKGTLNWMERGTSPVGITLTGKNCHDFIEAAKTARLEIIFHNVKHQIGTNRTPILTLQVVETP
jgi:hypothetical protein